LAELTKGVAGRVELLYPPAPDRRTIDVGEAASTLAGERCVMALTIPRRCSSVTADHVDDAGRHHRRRSVASCIAAGLAVATVGVLGAPAVALELPVTDEQVSVEDLASGTAVGLQSPIPADNPTLPTTEPTVLATEPPPATTEPGVPATEPPPATTEPTMPATEPPPATTEPTMPATEPPPGPAEPTAEEDLTVTPMTFPPGVTIEIEARTFKPGYPVRMVVGSDVRLFLTIASGSAYADESGVARLSLFIWEGVRPGRYPLSASGVAPDGEFLSLSVWVTVVPGAEPTANDSLTVTPTTVSPGQTIQVEARTFKPGGNVVLSFGHPAELVYTIDNMVADESGVVRLSVLIPPLRPGRYPFYAIGQTPDRGALTLTAWIDVVPAEAASDPPAVPHTDSTPPEPDPGATLPRTGGGSVGLAALGIVVVAGGWLLTTVAGRLRPH
jgi:hypothetical protein